MYGDVFLFETENLPIQKAERLAFGNTAGRDEKWLQGTLFEHPDILPINSIDPSFGPLIPLCREMKTDVGPVDIVYINPFGRITLVECKLWRNPQARREVVAQILDYASSICRWSYSDLQRQISIAVDKTGNVPFEKVKEIYPEIDEHLFVDQTTKAIKQGNFLLIIAGDGIKEDVNAIADLVNRNAGAKFCLGLVEVGLFGLENGGLIIQPRVLVKTTIIERMVFSIENISQQDEIIDSNAPKSNYYNYENPSAESPKQAAFRAWWQPILDMKFDDPEQDPVRLFYPNYVKAALPWPKSSIYAYRYEKNGSICVLLDCPHELREQLDPLKDEILSELPEGTEYYVIPTNGLSQFRTLKKYSDFNSEEEKKNWVIDVIRCYSNTLRPRIVQIMRNLTTAST
jgi:hypothetical protein